jgi:tRNA(Arg) A34 adenosine deaminase TadA
MDENDLRLMRAAIEVAWRARENGNHPFGALLVDREGNVLLEAENTVVTQGDCTGHAETNLMRLATQAYGADLLAGCTVYASIEPCPMCSGAIYGGNVRRVVYGLSEESLYEMVGDSPEALYLPCREVFGRGRKPIVVVGPVLEEEVRRVHEGFWR